MVKPKTKEKKKKKLLQPVIKSEQEVKERILKEESFFRSNDLEFITNWRQKLRKLKTEEYNKEVDGLLLLFEKTSEKIIKTVNEEFEKYLIVSESDLNVESEFVDTVEKIASEHCTWANNLEMKHQTKFQQQLNNQEKNLSNLKNFYGVVLAHVQNQIENLEKRIEDSTEIINQSKSNHESYRKAEKEYENHLINNQKYLALLQNRIQLIYDKYENESESLRNEYFHLMKCTTENQTFIELKNVEIKNLEKNIKSLSKHIKTLDSIDMEIYEDSEMGKENIRRMRRQISKIQLTKASKLKKICYEKSLQENNFEVLQQEEIRKNTLDDLCRQLEHAKLQF